MRFGGGDRFGGPPPRGGLIYFHEMPRAAQKDIRAAAREGFRVRNADRAAQMVNVLDVLRAEPFVAADLRGIMATQSQAFQANQMRMTEIWIGHLEAMSDEERRAYADRVEAAAKHPHHMGKPAGE
jgi:tryptophan 2,3-dioxygenase